ncbi:dual specificity protein phosphatase 1-like isoform X1 [Phytophthora cinnamomi]|uniref:dual specificity protein phosphatase 1-like isoform X1 n=1 Tax=Phytophthora cinnamomi TaxID=4785 RepID=UPI003559C3FC|nr:dual specificity protein phosphatase 1-like isoform X1 [Phytophthora cinnamomi]
MEQTPDTSTERHEAEARMLNLRFCIAYWELALLLPAVDGEDDPGWRRRVFREELLGFHQLVVNGVTHGDVMTHARESLRLAWQDCSHDEEDAVADENWARVAPEDARVGLVNDLQLVAPGVWIGSADTLAFVELLAERDIQHRVYCTTTQQETRLTSSEDGGVVELFDLPRQQFEDVMACADGVEQLSTLSSSSCKAITRIASSLSALIGTNSKAEAPRRPGHGGVLLYCDSGISTSIAMCAALLMTRYELPLALAMELLRAARRDISPSRHLRLQLELSGVS